MTGLHLTNRLSSVVGRYSSTVRIATKVVKLRIIPPKPNQKPLFVALLRVKSKLKIVISILFR